MKRIKDKLCDIDTEQRKGAQIRPRAYMLTNREQPSHYFYRKELNQPGQGNTVSTVQDDRFFTSKGLLIEYEEVTGREDDFHTGVRRYRLLIDQTVWRPSSLSSPQQAPPFSRKQAPSRSGPAPAASAVTRTSSMTSGCTGRPRP